MRQYKIFIEGDTFDKGTGGLPNEGKVTTKIAPVDIEDANSEIEKGELVLDPKTGALHKALGKPHSKGGTPVNLKNNSFIFSNFKGLAIDNKQKKLFEFKMGGSKAKNNTPAKILEREVDLKHHNKMADILQNEKKFDTPTLNAAKLMMLRNLEKAGQVAFIQESKKGDQIPDFAQETAPIYSKDTDQKISQSMQYLQEGGWGNIFGFQPPKKDVALTPAKGNFFVYGPNGEILKEMDANGKLVKDFGVKLPVEKKTPVVQPKTTFVPTNVGSPTDPTIYDKANALYAKAEKSKSKADVLEFQKYFHENFPNVAKQIVGADPDVTTYGKKMGYGKDDLRSNEEGLWGKRTIQYKDALNKLQVKPETPIQKTAIQVPQKDKVTITTPEQSQWTPPIGSGTKPGEAEGIVDPTNYNTKLSTWQKFNALIPFYRAATVKTQYPLRQHQESVIPQFENINAQPQINQANQGYFNAANILRTLNPNQAASYMGQLAGNRIDTTNQILGNVQNQNIQTQNRQKEMAAESLNKDAAQNRMFDKDFYDKTQTAIKNRDELKQAYEQQGIQGINDMMSKKLAFDSWMNTQQQYKGAKTYVDKNGIQHYQGTALYTPKAGFWGNTVQYNPAGIDWKTYQSTQNNKDDNFEAQVKTLRESFPGASDADILKFMTGKGNQKALSGYSQSQLPPQKMGGRIRTKNKLY